MSSDSDFTGSADKAASADLNRERSESPTKYGVAGVLEWCAHTGKPPHQCFQFSVHATNVAGQIWNEWGELVPELRSMVLLELMERVISGSIQFPASRP